MKYFAHPILHVIETYHKMLGVEKLYCLCRGGGTVAGLADVGPRRAGLLSASGGRGRC